LAALALLISIVTATYTAFFGAGGRYEQQRTMRNQLTDVLKTNK
jgi:hypothetical protein